MDNSSADNIVKPKLLVVADLGRLRAFRLEQDPLRSPRAKLVEEWNTNVTQHLREEVTDQAGQLRKGVVSAEGPSALSDGEQHNLDLERRRRAAKAIAGHVDELLNREDVDGCYLAADARINQTILDHLTARGRGKVQKNVTANLSKASVENIIQHFSE